jgi:hypothetical protein
MSYYISDSQFDATDLDCPDFDIISDALSDVLDELSPEGVWAYKGSYRLHFWIDQENPDTVFCNAFVLVDPEDDNSTETHDYGYYFEICKEKQNVE